MWIAYGVGASVATALFVVLTKKGLESAKPMATLAIQAGLSLLVAMAFLAARSEVRTVGDFGRKTWMLVVGAGVLIGLAAVLRLMALGTGPASGVASLDQLSLVFTTIPAIIFLSDEFNWKVGLGVAMIAGGAVLVSLGQAK